MFGKSKLGINPVSYFVQILYNECKTYKVTPPIAVKWTRDMLDFFSVKNSSLGSYPNLNEQILEGMPERNKDNYKGDDNSNQANYIISYTEYSSISTVQKDPSVNDFDLPLVSKVSFFIDRKKAEINKLLELEEKVRVKIREQVKQKANIESKIQNLVVKLEEKFRYLEQYKNLEQELYAKYKLKLDNEIEPFCKPIFDFKHYDYEPWRIISEYKNIESLKQSKISLQEDIKEQRSVRDHLSRQISILKNQLCFCTQEISTYKDLCGYGFGLKELKIVRQTLVQIAVANHMRPEEVGKKFLKDIEDQYDDKVGFKNIIEELKTEKIKIKEEIPLHKSTLTLQALASVSLLNLHNNGVTDIDIILLNSLVSECIDTDSFSNVLDNQNDDNYDNNEMYFSKHMNNNNINQSNSNKQFGNMQNNLCKWKIFIQKLRKIKNSNSLIKSKNLHPNTLADQTNELTDRKQGLESL